jgi:hypothetical protein
LGDGELQYFEIRGTLIHVARLFHG